MGRGTKVSQTIFIVGFWTSSIVSLFIRTEEIGKQHLVSTVCACASSSVTYVQFIEIRKLNSLIITRRNIRWNIQPQHCSYTMQICSFQCVVAVCCCWKWTRTNTKGTAMDLPYPSAAIQTILAIINVLYCHCWSCSGIPDFPTLLRAWHSFVEWTEMHLDVSLLWHTKRLYLYPHWEIFTLFFPEEVGEGQPGT